MTESAGPWNAGSMMGKFHGVGKALHERAAQAVEEVADLVLEEANTRVPHEYGDLQDSGKVSVDAAELQAAVSYDTPYAVRQHEEMSYRHDAGREAKYLENSLNHVANSGAAEAVYKRRLGGLFEGGS